MSSYKLSLSYNASSMIAQLLTRIRKRETRLAIVGAGYVGLTLAVKFARAGFRVTGFDIDNKRVRTIQQGLANTSEISSAELRTVLRKKLLNVTTDPKKLVAPEIILICVPTPLTSSHQPDLRPLTSAIKTVAKYGNNNQLLVLISTSFPGTVEELVIPLLKKFSKNLPKYISVVPERIDPGNKKIPVADVPLVVGGINHDSTRLASALFSTWVNRIVPVSSTRAAEMTKLLENSFRFINISFINEFAQLTASQHVNIREVIAAAETKPYGFMPFSPGPGVGGQCIPVDPIYLNWRLQKNHQQSQFIRLAKRVNDAQPIYVIQRLADFLKQHNLELRKVSLIILGLTYKPESSDLTESPALQIFLKLKNLAHRVDYVDPQIPAFVYKHKTYTSRPLQYPQLKQIDCVILLVNHRIFNYQKIKQYSRLLFDTRGMYQKDASPKIELL